MEYQLCSSSLQGPSAIAHSPHCRQAQCDFGVTVIVITHQFGQICFCFCTLLDKRSPSDYILNCNPIPIEVLWGILLESQKMAVLSGWMALWKCLKMPTTTQKPPPPYNAPVDQWLPSGNFSSKRGDVSPQEKTLGSNLVVLAPPPASTAN